MSNKTEIESSHFGSCVILVDVRHHFRNEPGNKQGEEDYLEDESEDEEHESEHKIVDPCKFRLVKFVVEHKLPYVHERRRYFSELICNCRKQER